MFTTCDFIKEVIKKPEVTLKSVDFSEVDFTGLTLLNTLEVRNNISIDIPLPKIDWELFVIENSFLKGAIENEGLLKSNESTDVQFPVSFEYVDLIKAITAMTDENAKYKIKMTAHIPVPGLGDLPWPFEHEGKIPLMRMPDITVATAPKASITYGSGLIPGVSIPTGGKIEFALNVKNNSNVAVTVNDLSYDFKVGNNLLSHGGIPNKPSIDPGETEKITVEFPLAAADILNVTLIGILTGSSFNFELTGNYKFGIPEFPLLNEVGDSFTLP